MQDKKDLNLYAEPGVAVRDVVMKPGHGRVDYLLYVDEAMLGVIEAKPQGTPLPGVEWQAAMYAEGLPADVCLKALTTGGTPTAHPAELVGGGGYFRLEH